VRRWRRYTERGEEGLLCREPTEDCQSDECHRDGQQQALADMFEAEVAELVGEDCLDFRVGQALEQGIEENDALVVADTREIRFPAPQNLSTDHRQTW